MKIEEIITSINNKKIIETNKLKNKKERHEKKEYLVEGIKNVYEYIRYKKTEEIIHVYIKEELYNEYISGKIKRKKEQISYIFEMIEENESIKIHLLKENVFNKITNDTNPEGIIIKVKLTENKANSLNSTKNEFNQNIKMVFENISDPGNLGTIIRTAVAVGLDTIYISKNSVDIYSHKVIRSSAGMIFKINIIQDDIEKILETLKNEKYTLVKTVMNGENLYTFAEENVQKKKEKIAIFFGNEANGISDYLKENISKSISIPMEKETESLNLGVSFSIIIYELYRANLM